jgi:uncharacterized membrane protein
LAAVDRLAAAAPQADGKELAMGRLLQNLSTGRWHLAKIVSANEQLEIARAVQAAEKATSAQIKVVIEASMHFIDVIRGQTARDRALEVFGVERVWDTSHNNGILLYLLLSERDAEIVVDRGFNEKVAAAQWQEVCSALEADARAGGLGQAVRNAIAAIGRIAEQAFPSRGHTNELSDDVRLM